MAARGLLIGVLRECLAGSGEGNERGTRRRGGGEARPVSTCIERIFTFNKK